MRARAHRQSAVDVRRTYVRRTGNARVHISFRRETSRSAYERNAFAFTATVTRALSLPLSLSRSFSPSARRIYINIRGEGGRRPAEVRMQEEEKNEEAETRLVSRILSVSSLFRISGGSNFY